MKCFHRTAALLAAAVLACCALTGCGEGYNLAEEDMPYGATIREDKSTYAVPVSYDRRFLNEEQLTVITNYIAAIQNSDAALYTASTLDFYAEYQLNEVYSENYSTMDEMVAALHQSVADGTGNNFTYNMVNIEDCTQESVTSGLDTMLEILETIDEENDFISTVDNCWALNMEWFIKYDGGSMIVSDQKLFMVEIDGEYFCVM